MHIYMCVLICIHTHCTQVTNAHHLCTYVCTHACTSVVSLYNTTWYYI